MPTEDGDLDVTLPMIFGPETPDFLVLEEVWGVPASDRDRYGVEHAFEWKTLQKLADTPNNLAMLVGRARSLGEAGAYTRIRRESDSIHVARSEFAQREN